MFLQALFRQRQRSRKSYCCDWPPGGGVSLIQENVLCSSSNRLSSVGLISNQSGEQFMDIMDYSSGHIVALLLIYTHQQAFDTTTVAQACFYYSKPSPV